MKIYWYVSIEPVIEGSVSTDTLEKEASLVFDSQVDGPLRMGARQLPPPRAPDETPENRGATYRLGEVGRGVGEDGLAAVVAIGALHTKSE